MIAPAITVDAEGKLPNDNQGSHPDDISVSVSARKT